jgi:hypothetical protein
MAHRWQDIDPAELARPDDPARFWAGLGWGLLISAAFWVPVVAGVYFGMIR